MSVTRVIRRREARPSLPDLPGLHPVLARVLAARQVRAAEELDYSLGRLHPFEALGQIEQAADLIAAHVEEGRRIVIVGDFDADGATSSTLAMRALTAMGAAEVSYLVPNRFDYGYGLTPEIVAVAAGREPDLLITVDNGVSSIEGVRAANAAGITVVVTDHHLPGRELPEAAAIVNPNLHGDPFPSKAIAGVGVIFYVMLAVRARLRQSGWFERRSLAEPNMAGLLDLVALGTVADVVPLDHVNRLFVEQGLRRIRAGKCVPGIRALLRVAGRNPARLVASDLGFVVGPRLNAAGRLEDMSIGIECLLTDDEARAEQLATELDRMNRERRAIESEMRDQALAALGEVHLDADTMPMGLALFEEEWHQGVIGILASRIKEQFHRPVIAFAPENAGSELIKGSARSIPGLHIRDALDSVATRHPGLITKFGGHAMAAGMSLPRVHLDRFREAFDAVVREVLSEDDLKGVIHSDGELAAGDLTLELAEALRGAGPWGQCFPEPVFDGIFRLDERRVVGERHLKVRVAPLEGAASLDGIAFNADFAAWPEAGQPVRLAYRLDVNEYRGERKAQLVIEHAEPPPAR